MSLKMPAPPPDRWIVLIVSQPTGNAAVRMRVWREIRSRGAAILRDGAYLLPARPELSAAFATLAAAVLAAGGSAHVLNATADEAQNAEWRGLFERGAEYAELLAQIPPRAARARQPVEAARAACRELEAQFAAIAATDYFGNAGRAQVAQALADWRAQIERRAAPDEPRAQARSIERLRRQDFQGRVWATRRGLWVDRVASAWLIRRFIDPQARFVWIARPEAKPKRALGFDFDGAQFTHQPGRVTFEVLLSAFGLDDDAALVRLGRVIHALDIGGVPVAEAAGIEAVLSGLRRQHGGDDGFLAAARHVFDACHAAFADAVAEEHR
jgi:hypothetical protein